MRSKDELKKAVEGASSMAEVIRRLGLNKSRSTYTSIRNQIELYGIPVKFNKHRTAKRYSDDRIFCEQSTYDRKELRKKVIRENKLLYKCSMCGIMDWNGQPLSLQLDHINGINNDNRLENLRFLCPNCHSQTLTWGNKK